MITNLRILRILKDYYNIDLTTFFTQDTAIYTRGHYIKFLNIIFDYLFTPTFLRRVVNSWNSLSDENISSSTVGHADQG